MKAAIVLCFSIALAMAADPKPPAAAPKAVVKPTSIPAAAVETGPGMYRFTDAAGVHWLLRKTPFGVAAVEEKSADLVKATDAGDSVRFDQASPFGSHSWTRRKTELNESEREIWERQSGREAAR